jgi:hypothetical protein
LLKLADPKLSVLTRVTSLLAFEPVFGLDLRSDQKLVLELTSNLELLESQGSLRAVSLLSQ